LSIVVLAAVAWYLFRPERLFIDFAVDEGFPSLASGEAEPAVVAQGAFHGVAHGARGEATIYQLSDGRRILRFTNFETSNGPDVHVYLVAAPDADDSATVQRAAFITLGALKGNVGDQNYDLPADVDLGRYRSVTIWCRRFSVNFATAPLHPAK
jgi:hypothetical protein